MGELRECFLCGRNGQGDRLERHHIFGGPNRGLSEKYGLTVWLCGDRCHRNGPYAVHNYAPTAEYIHRYGEQKMLDQGMTRGQFIELFGKDYL